MRRWAVCDADWNHWPDGLSDAGIWPAVAGAGFAGIEICVYSAPVELAPSRMAERERLAAAHRLPVRAVLLSLSAQRWPHGALTGDIDRVVAEAAACASTCVRLGLDLLGVWPGADPAGAPWSRLISGLARVRDVAAARGVGVAVEYKPGTVVSTCADAIRLAADVPGTGVLLDTGHAWAGGEDPVECVRRLDHLLWHVHLGDAAEGAPDDDLPLGRRHDAWPLVAALDATYSGVASLDLYGAVSAGMCTGVAAGKESLGALTGGA
jgi:sugar phosphate isomerase/epimerase